MDTYALILGMLGLVPGISIHLGSDRTGSSTTFGTSADTLRRPKPPSIPEKTPVHGVWPVVVPEATSLSYGYHCPHEPSGLWPHRSLYSPWTVRDHR